MDITLMHYLCLSMALFAVGVFGVLMARKSLIHILMSLELMLLGVNLTFVSFSRFHGEVTGQVFSLFILTVAAAEAAIGLAILVVYFREKRTIQITDMVSLGEKVE